MGFRIDLATVIAIVCGVSLVFFAMSTVAELDLFLDLLSIIFVSGGIIALIVANCSFANFANTFLHVLKFAVYRPVSSRKVAITSIKVAEFCHKKSTLQIEDEQQLERKVPTFYKWLRYVVDGQSQERVQYSIDREIRTLSDVHNSSVQVMKRAAAEAPVVGGIGSLIILIAVFASSNNILASGEMIASALLPLLYGLVLSHFIFVPLSSKLSRIAEGEITNLQIYRSAVFSIAAGEHPRALEQAINAALPPSQQVHYFAS